MSDEYISVQQASEFADTFYAHDPVARMICRALIKAVPKVEAVTDNNVGDKWIPVTERLPKGECRCLVVDATGDIEMDIFDGNGGFILDRSGARQHPSHWMPLPEPPKEGE